MVDKDDYIIGIDFGTTNSCSAMFINNKLEVIPDKNTGQRTIPSVVCYMENNQVLVGDVSKLKQIEYSQSTIFQCKRYIGHKFKDPEVKYDLEHRRMYITITEDYRTEKAMYVVKIGDEKNKKFLLPEDVASEIIKYIKQSAEKYLYNKLHKQITIKNAVITVPTHFNDYRIATVIEAFMKANLNVVNVIKEPEAIGIAYGYFHTKRKQTKILTIDIGGGTFGMSILQIQGDKYEIIGSIGSGHLGGDDFEKALRDYIVQQIEKENKYALDFSIEKKHKDIKWVRVLLKIKEKTSKVISELSTKEKVKFEIKQLDGKKDFTINISQDKYKELTKGLLGKCEKKLKELFKNLENKISYNEIDEIILVGGTTRAPYIKEILEKYFKKETIFHALNPDEIVAQGAAISAIMKDKTDYIIGIDFGTTNSCSAMFINNKLEVIPDQSTGRGIIPSVVCYMENNEVLVGKLALGKQIEYSYSTIFQSKRYIGHLFKDPEVQYDLQHKRMYVTITKDTYSEKAMYVAKIDENNKKFLYPEDVASEIIKYIKENAEKYLKNILNKEIILTKAVITVPVHFNDYRIATVKEAFMKARLNVVIVIKEPEAIGIAYGYFHTKKKLTKILTIDIGGGTFGMSILQIQGDKYEIIGSEGSGHLGGDDFEKALRDYIVQQIEKENKYALDFSIEKKHKYIKWVRVLLKIKEETSRVIIQLSNKKNVKFEIKQLDGKNDFTINISQDKYKELTKGLLVKFERILKTLFDRVKNQKNITYKDIDEIILVGGSTKAPNIQNIFEKYFDKRTIFQTLNANGTIIAQGAAIITKILKK